MKANTFFEKLIKQQVSKVKKKDGKSQPSYSCFCSSTSTCTGVSLRAVGSRQGEEAERYRTSCISRFSLHYIIYHLFSPSFLLFSLLTCFAFVDPLSFLSLSLSLPVPTVFSLLYFLPSEFRVGDWISPSWERKKNRKKKKEEGREEKEEEEEKEEYSSLSLSQDFTLSLSLSPSRSCLPGLFLEGWRNGSRWCCCYLNRKNQTDGKK